MSVRILPLLLAVAGCATIERGTTQVVQIQPDPADASCTVMQGPAGTPVAPVDGKVELPRSRLILTVACSKPDYQKAQVLKPAMYSQKPFGGMSYLVDVSSGANYSYPPIVKVTLAAIQPETLSR